jgi:hypothetical protein
MYGLGVKTVSNLDERVSFLEKRIEECLDKSEQEARIALLNDYASKLQGYKTNLLTIAIGVVGFFQTFEILNGWAARNGLPNFSLIFWPLVVASLSAIAFFLSTRAVWHAALLRQCLLASPDLEVNGPLIYKLNQGISRWARSKQQREQRYKIAYGKTMFPQKDNKIWLMLVNLGYNTGKLAMVTAVIAIAIGTVALGILIWWP